MPKGIFLIFLPNTFKFIIVMADSKVLIRSDVVLVIYKITEQKLPRSNYQDLNQIVRVYFWSIAQHHHLPNDPPSNDTRNILIQNDDHLCTRFKIPLMQR